MRAANDNSEFFNSTYQLVRETGQMIEDVEAKQERERQEFIQQQLIEIGRI